MATTPLKISIREIKLLHYQSTTRVQEIKKQLTNDLYEFQFDLQWGAIEVEKLFNVLLSVTLYEKQSPETKVELANIKVSSSFEIMDFDQVIRKENGMTAIPDQLIPVTAGIVVSTTRGMFALSVENSIISNAIIPLINPKVFLPKRD